MITRKDVSLNSRIWKKLFELNNLHTYLPKVSREETRVTVVTRKNKCDLDKLKSKLLSALEDTPEGRIVTWSADQEVLTKIRMIRITHPGCGK